MFRLKSFISFRPFMLTIRFDKNIGKTNTKWQQFTTQPLHLWRWLANRLKTIYWYFFVHNFRTRSPICYFNPSPLFLKNWPSISLTAENPTQSRKDAPVEIQRVRESRIKNLRKLKQTEGPLKMGFIVKKETESF